MVALHILIFLVATAYVASSNVLHFALKTRRFRESKPSTTYNRYDDVGDVVQLKEADLLVGNSNPVAILRTNNGTIIAYPRQNKTSILCHIDINHLNQAGQSKVYFILTGLYVDCRVAINYFHDYITNATYTYGNIPSTEIIAHSIGKYFQKMTSLSTNRPFACHAFICDTRQNRTNKPLNISISSSILNDDNYTYTQHEPIIDEISDQDLHIQNISHSHSNDKILSISTSHQETTTTIYEIQPSGLLFRIRGSVIGKGSHGQYRQDKNGYELLNDLYHSNITVEEGRKIVIQVIQHCQNITCHESDTMSAESEEENKESKKTSVNSDTHIENDMKNDPSRETSSDDSDIIIHILQ